jgi:carbamate kinase
MQTAFSPGDVNVAKPIAVLAFGGNAILEAGDDGTFATQLEKAKAACRQMLTVLKMGYGLVMVHGNGPQVGNLLIQFDRAKDRIPVPPLDVAGAASQGLLGYMLEISMRAVLAESRMESDVATILTQVLVDPDDPAFSNPTKPIGPFYSREVAEHHRTAEGWSIVEDSGRGWRRVVCSPQPREVLELGTIKRLAEAGTVVIACGGGGIPVHRLGDQLVGIEGVIDKDSTAALLAQNIGAELFMILTAVDRVYVDFGRPTQRAVDVMTVGEAQKWLAEGQFPPGSMGPKIRSAIEYVENGGLEAIITSQNNITAALQSSTCTRIVKQNNPVEALS